MENDSIILITIIASTLLNPLLNFFIHSRCSRIKCGCIECDREILDIENQTENQTEDNK